MEVFASRGLQTRYSYNDMEVWSCGDAQQVWRHGGVGGLESRCKCVDVKVWRNGDLDVWSRDVGLRSDVEVWRSGGARVASI